VSDLTQSTLAIIARISEKPLDTIKPDMDLMVDLGIDSPKALELLIEIEEKVGIEISDEDAAELDSVGDVLAFVAQASSTGA
jgi:acyl carrier protein